MLDRPPHRPSRHRGARSTTLRPFTRSPAGAPTAAAAWRRGAIRGAIGRCLAWPGAFLPSFLANSVLFGSVTEQRERERERERGRPGFNPFSCPSFLKKLLANSPSHLFSLPLLAATLAAGPRALLRRGSPSEREGKERACKDVAMWCLMHLLDCSPLSTSTTEPHQCACHIPFRSSPT